jgi:hypothetical protein
MDGTLEQDPKMEASMNTEDALKRHKVEVAIFVYMAKMRTLMLAMTYRNDVIDLSRPENAPLRRMFNYKLN